MSRALDIALAGIGLALAAPLLLIAAVAIKLDSRGPVIYRQRRVGKDGQQFEVYKLRTMRLGADPVGVGTPVLEDDPRVTRVGRLLRRFSLDEIPNLVNVLRGELAIVGPRPTLAAQVELLHGAPAPPARGEARDHGLGAGQRPRRDSRGRSGSSSTSGTWTTARWRSTCASSPAPRASCSAATGCTGRVLGHRQAAEAIGEPLFASLATLAAIAAFAATSTTHAGTRAGVTCRFDIATHRLTVTFHNDDANGGIVRDGDDLVVEDVFGPLGCAGAQDPTRFNTERVRVRARAASVDDLDFELDLRRGPFAPGFSDEGDGSSEIEFSVSLPAGSASRVPIHGRRGPDRIVLGHLAHGQGANLNAAEDVDDPDVTIRGGILLVYGFRGADVISARGGDGFIGPYPRSVFAFGARGDDRLIGGPKRDDLFGGRGHDTMKGDGGRDFLSARDGTRDVVRCGRGSDFAEVDRSIGVRRCEDVRTADGSAVRLMAEDRAARLRARGRGGGAPLVQRPAGHRRPGGPPGELHRG